MEKNYININIEIPKELHKKIRMIVASKHNMTMKQWITDLIEEKTRMGK